MYLRYNVTIDDGDIKVNRYPYSTMQYSLRYTNSDIVMGVTIDDANLIIYRHSYLHTPYSLRHTIEIAIKNLYLKIPV